MFWDAGQARQRREAEADFDRLTTAVASGIAVSSSRDAWAAWQSRHGAPARDPASQAMTLGRLGRMFPGSVRRRAD
jgi:hypothetical protein